MNIRGYFLILLLVIVMAAAAGMRDPFPSGFSMGTLGAIIDDYGASSREPWTSAGFCADSAGFGFAVSGTSYYGSATGGIGNDGISQAKGGAWYARKHFICKTALASLTAFSAYFEQSGFVSIGSDYFRIVRFSIEAAGCRMGIRTADALVRTFAETGFSAWVPWSWAALSCRLEHLILETSGSCADDPPLTLKFGIHSARNRFGSQGALVTVARSEPKPVCFTIGEEYRITPSIAFHAALSNNPLFLSFGVAYSLDRAGISISLVNHPQLGWSQGFGAEYYRKK